MRRPPYDMRVFKKHREALAKKINNPKSAVILISPPELIRNNDVHHRHRQDSNIFYLTGFEEPETIFVFRPGLQPESVLFVRPKDEQKETWDGFRYGVTAAQSEFEIDEVYPLAEFDKKIIELLKPVERLYYRWNLIAEWDQKILKVLEDVRTSLVRTGKGYLPVFDSWELLARERLYKSDWEIENLREAGKITAEAHCEAMRFVKPGVNENQVMGVLLGTAHVKGANREGYGTIVASGANATTLHYIYNDQTCLNGDLLLIDAGFEKNYYTSDITRTFPVNGIFSPAQKRLYEGVLTVQKHILEMIKPGLLFRTLQETTIELLTDFMLDVGLLKGARKELIEKQLFKSYYMHGVSHWLGLDVHDLGFYKVGDESIPLVERMAFTVEPGLYIPAHDTDAPKEFRGMGIRIEDDVIVTATGCEILTSGVPKEVSAIEALMSEPSRWS